ncbi:efflux RND transporter periplasmic adaptor subunit [Helicovermis profundi]|uniref:Efflux RND transporter periplasmic adaptor subunit n=1 Tax=Helicovermis profundi TaxID=3065157 RepID=A0AAU9E0Q8_9FIRM|nr:efflux RND transporter periplasmic adaptor subunit [Clostridia bacterium S502]
MFTKKRMIIIVTIVIILILGAVGYLSMKKGISVDLAITEKGDVIKSIEETGTIITKNNNTIYSKASGQISEVNFEIGDKVKKGQILIKLDTEDLLLKLEGMKATKEAMNYEYKEALKGADIERVNQLLTNVESARTSYLDLKRIYENNLVLYNTGALSKNDLDLSKSSLSRSSDNLNSATEELKLLRKGISKNVQERYLKQLENIQYEIEILNNSINNSEIKASEDFVVIEKYMSSGEYLNVGSPILKYSNGEVITSVDILASESRNIKRGTKVFVTDDSNKFKYEGKVTKVYPSAFTKVSDLGIEQKRVKVEVTFPEINEFTIGYDIDVEFITNELTNVVRLPDRAVFEKNNKKYVFISKNNKAVLNEVKIGLEGNDYYEIISGVAIDDLVILSPANEIEDGVLIYKEK